MQCATRETIVFLDRRFSVDSVITLASGDDASALPPLFAPQNDLLLFRIVEIIASVGSCFALSRNLAASSPDRVGKKCLH